MRSGTPTTAWTCGGAPRSTAIDLDRRLVRVDAEEIGYDRLLIATGSRPRRLDQADRSGGAVAYLRTLEDSLALRAAFEPGRHVVFVGAGWIGLEAAAAARTAGADVTVVETLELPLLRVLGPEVAATFADLHRGHGVDLRLGATIESLTDAGSGRTAVRLGDGSELTADLVVVGIGVTPNDALGAAAGLDLDNGILVDASLRTRDPYVYAAGDVANHLHPTLGRRIRVEHWDTAIEQGKVVARNLLGGDEPYTRLPYFFTDQYDLGMEYVGSVGPDGYDEVVLRGDTGRAVHGVLAARRPGRSPGCTSTTGTRSTRSARSSARRSTPTGSATRRSGSPTSPG